MKRLTAALITLAIAVSPTVIAQEESNLEAMFRDFGRSVTASGVVRLTVIHLNDATVEAFFSPPTKYSLRVQAKQTTIFYVHGTAERSMQLDGAWEVRQDTRVIGAKTIDIFNFTPGLVLADGDQFTGLVVLDQLVNPRAEFTLANGDAYRFNFLFTPGLVLADGDQFTGLVVLDQLVNPRAEFTLANGDAYRFDFLFSANAVTQIDGR